MTCVRCARFTTFCSHNGSRLFSDKSYTCTFPSLVTAAKTVDEYGAQATSPTAFFKSNDIMGVDTLWSHNFTVQSAEQDKNTRGWNGFHFTLYTAMW